MKTFSAFITERFQNAIGPDDPLKKKYAQQVYALLQASYAKIGGIKGNGFENKEDMIANILFWKMAIKDGKVEAAILYKDKGGRKSVAIGSTGSAWARIKIADMFKNEIKRSYGEKSKSALGLMLKVFPENAIIPFLHTPEVAGKTLKKEVTPIKDVPKDRWPDDAKRTIEKFPYIIDYGYLREIAGTMMFKVMIGTSGKSIK